MNRTDLQSFLSNVSALPRTTTLFRESGLRSLLLRLKAGESIPEHQTPGAILVHCLAGKGVFFVGDDRAELLPGMLISLPASVPHGVAAAEQEDIVMLVTISEVTTGR